MKSDIKIKKAIESTENWIATCNDKTTFRNGSYTILGCEVRNLKYYKEMLGKDKRTLKGFHKELYQAI